MQGQGAVLRVPSAAGSMSSTLSREDNMVMSSEDSSNPDDGELELGLGLSLGGGGFKQRYNGRIFTAKDLPSAVVSASSSSPSSSTSSSSSTLSRANGSTVGTKRSADSVAAPNGAASQVVGWPPIRAYRMNSIVNQAKSVATEEFSSMIDKNKENAGKAMNGNNMNDGNSKARPSLFVKVMMDGIPIGRKVDLNAHGCYKSLAETLEDMFLKSTTTTSAIRSSALVHNTMLAATGRSKLLNGLSDFVLTYEDKDGDWMLVGDVPWGMFLCTVKRLRIMRTSEATGLAPRFQERNGRLGSKPI